MQWCVLVLLGLVNAGVCQNCRGEKPRVRDCDKVCDEQNNCKIRAALLLPKNTTYDACLSAVGPVLELAMEDPVIKDAFPSWLSVEWLKYDVTDCDAAYAVISAIDAYNDCAHVFFGPSCDFALASVARIAKFLGGTGTPLVTTGGFTFDFVKPKQTCQDEFYMLVRAGPLGFEDMAYFIIDLMRHFEWKQLLLINEPESQLHIAGKSTCHLMMKSFANFLKKEDMIYTPWDTTSDAGLNYTENLKFYLGYKYTKIPIDSEGYCDWKCPGCLSVSLLSKSKNDCTPVRNVSTTRGNKRPALNSPPETAASLTSEEVRSIVQEVIKSEFADMLKQINSTIMNIVNRELNPIRKDIRELSVSLTFHTNEFEKFQSEHVVLKNMTRELKDDNIKLQGTVADLSQRLNYLEQQARANNLELQCLPENKKENLYTVVKQLGSVVGCEIKDNDISHCTRIAKLNTANSRPRSIVIQLASPRMRDQLLASVIEYNKKNTHNKLNSADFGLAGNKSPVYVAEHLSPAYKALHAATRLKAKEKGYKYVWVRSGRIFVRKMDGDDHILIKSLDTLNKMK